MPTTLQNQTALVTGANRGIGKALVETFLKHGARKVYAAVRDPKSAEALVAAHGDRVVPLRLDLADADSILAAAAAAPDVAIVVNNGGVLTTTGPLDDAVFDSLEYEMEVNVRGLLRVARAFAPVLKA
ncbi:MAG: SDR family NAD(P)-dependent oxidoreductase [Verrucomicrobiales bacterium]|nr:SDR family NAD(P)-dependent oxidoreductase [Verrucomicrobiales bacterium]